MGCADRNRSAGHSQLPGTRTDSNRTQLTTTASVAQHAEKISASVGPLATGTLKAMATNAVPKLCPNTLIVACIPPAAPLRERGAEESMARLFGV